jgi:hypothetical protein
MNFAMTHSDYLIKRNYSLGELTVIYTRKNVLCSIFEHLKFATIFRDLLAVFIRRLPLTKYYTMETSSDLLKNNAIKTYGGVEVYLQAFLISALERSASCLSRFTPR